MRIPTIAFKISLTILPVFCFTSSYAKELNFATRESRPYMIKNETDMAGIDYEIITAALAHRGHSIKWKFFPYARLVATFNDSKELDGAGPTLPSFKLEGTLTEPFTTYQNIALSLEKANFTINSINDLAPLNVISFPNARQVLGPIFASTVGSNPNYREETNQQVQLLALYKGRLDVVVGDRRVLNYWTKHPTSELDLTVKTVEHRLFQPVHYSAVFRDPALAEDFNAGLAAIKASGAYDAILKKY
jgi:polar amino acid transport system substrate-binding protein